MRVEALEFFHDDISMLITGVLLIITVMALTIKVKREIPRGWANMMELFVIFIRDSIAAPFLGEKDARLFTPLLCSFFMYILTLNILGLFPLFVAATSNINVTGALACITLSFMIFGTIYRGGVAGYARALSSDRHPRYLLPIIAPFEFLRCGLFDFYKALVPGDLPWYMIPLIAPVEFISIFSRAFALMVRLFANMLAGHIIIYALLGLIAMFGIWASPVIVLTVLIYFFEVFIAFFQAYIFTLLSAIFMGILFHPEH